MMLMELKYKERTGEIFVVRHSATHKWFCFPKMGPEKALLLKTCDTETDGRARFTAHTAFEVPATPEGVLKRQSIELCTMAFF